MTIQTSSAYTPAVTFGKNKKLSHSQQRAKQKAAFRSSLAQSQPATPKHKGLLLGVAGIISFALVPILAGLSTPKTNGLSYDVKPQEQPVLGNAQPDTPTPKARPPILHSDVRTDFPQWR